METIKGEAAYDLLEKMTIVYFGEIWCEGDEVQDTFEKLGHPEITLRYELDYEEDEDVDKTKEENVLRTDLLRIKVNNDRFLAETLLVMHDLATADLYALLKDPDSEEQVTELKEENYPMWLLCWWD